ncbi:MAG TPA: right-handed parallel beta-helix repeat-containing protein [Methylocella sp.]|nr:right-handed parallel beta-helix repeat-containing protein [Methylocella sp.]
MVNRIITWTLVLTTVLASYAPASATPSPNGTVVPPAASLTDDRDGVWTLDANGNCYRSQWPLPDCTNVMELMYYNNTVFIKTKAGKWLQWIGVDSWSDQISNDPSTTPLNGICGNATVVAAGSEPTSNLCAQGTPSPATGNGPWTWTCSGANGGPTASCSAPLAVANAACGTSNGSTMSSAPISNLCSAGTASSVSGSGAPWTWTCSQTNGTAASCWATKSAYYVAPSGSDSNTGTSSSAPFKTIGKAVGTATTAGNIVYVMNGTYVEQLNIAQSGTATSPITFTNYPDHSPVINFGGNWGNFTQTGTYPYVGEQPVVYLSGNYLVWNGIEVRNCNSSAGQCSAPANYVPTYNTDGIAIAGNNDTISNTTVDFIPNVGIYLYCTIGGGSYGPNNSVIENVTVHDVSLLNYNGATSSTGWASGVAEHGCKDNTHFLSNNTVSGSLVYDNWGEGIYSYFGGKNENFIGNISYNNYSIDIGCSSTQNCVIANNIAYEVSAPSASAGVRGIVVAYDNDTVDPFSNNEVYNNAVYGAQIFIAGSGSNPPTITNTIVRNNTVVNPSGQALFLGGPQSGLVLENNIFDGSLTSYSVPVSIAIANYWATNPGSPYYNSAFDQIGDASIYMAQTGGAPSPGALTSQWFSRSSPQLNGFGIH